MAVQSVLPPSATRPVLAREPKKPSALLGLLIAVGSNLNVSTVLLVGACVQSALVLLLPSLYALTPAVLLLLVRAVDTYLMTKGFKANRYLEGVVPRKSTAVVYDEEGEYSGPSAEKVAVLLLGAKVNHPLGIFAPDFKLVNDYMDAMNDELESGADQSNGFLGQTGYTRKDANGSSEFMAISYWRSLEDVQAYAHGPLHSKAWQWWDRTIQQHDHIGFMHEVYEADRGHWENVYINFQPVDLGATTMLRRNGKLEGGTVAPEWVSPLLDANRGKLRTSSGRRGHVNAAADRDKFGKNVYVS